MVIEIPALFVKILDYGASEKKYSLKPGEQFIPFQEHDYEASVYKIADKSVYALFMKFPDALRRQMEKKFYVKVQDTAKVILSKNDEELQQLFAEIERIEKQCAYAIVSFKLNDITLMDYVSKLTDNKVTIDTLKKGTIKSWGYRRYVTLKYIVNNYIETRRAVTFEDPEYKNNYFEGLPDVIKEALVRKGYYIK